MRSLGLIERGAPGGPLRRFSGLAEHIGRIAIRLRRGQLLDLGPRGGGLRPVLGDVGSEPVTQRAGVVGRQFAERLIGGRTGRLVGQRAV